MVALKVFYCNFPSISSERQAGSKHHIRHSAYILCILIVILFECPDGNEIQLMFFIAYIFATKFWSFPHFKPKITLYVHSTALIRLYYNRNNLGVLMLEHYVSSQCYRRHFWADDINGFALHHRSKFINLKSIIPKSFTIYYVPKIWENLQLSDRNNMCTLFIAAEKTSGLKW